MQRCLELAAQGAGHVSPNPMVGSVIVVDDKIIAEGYHERAGQAHAEVNAMAQVTDKNLLQRATLYVNLEPCSHSGKKTPPCVDAIIAAKIPRVVVGMIDPNDKVSGRGIAKLQESGIQATVGILETNCLDLNRRFISFHSTRLPYIILKWAQTSDGFIAHSDGTSKWISGPESRKLVHQWRADEDAILVGKQTALLDNPHLTVRHVKGHSPLRIIIDRLLEVPKSHFVYDNEAPTIIFNSEVDSSQGDTSLAKINFNANVPHQILEELFKRNVLSVIIEGGAFTLSSFLRQGLWNEARIFTSLERFGEGIKAPAINGSVVETRQIQSDQLQIIRKEQPR